MRYLVLLLLAAACSPIYIPNTRNAPLFREQGEAQISGYLTTGGVDGQVAYAFTDHLAAIGSYSFGSTKRTTPISPTNTVSTEYSRKNSYGEIGLGYYNRSRSARYEIFAGYGIGQGTSYDQYSFFVPIFGPQKSVISTGKMQRIFFQPTIGTNNRDVNISFTPRLSLVSFSEFTSDTGVTVKTNEKAQFFIEPTATLKFRLTGNLHCLVQLGLAVPMGDPYFAYQPLQGAVGLQIDTGGMRTKVY